MGKQTLATLSGRPLIQEYAQGAARDATSLLADFIAPTVPVSKHAGKYKEYDMETRFKIPETLRGLGGDATQLAFDRNDKEFNCAPHALDTPLDNIEIEEAEGEDLLREAMDDAAWLGSLAHEKRVIDKALGAAGAASGGVWSNPAGAVDPVKEINQAIIDVIKAAGGGNIEVGLVMDPTIMLAFFAHNAVKGYFPGIDSIAPTIANMERLFVGRTKAQVSFLVTDTAPVGKSKAVNWLMAAKLLVFARSANPTRRDPSFMKTFRLRNRWMATGTYSKPDGRGEVVKMDWSEDTKVTNSAAAQLFTLS
jgi:hypothetical protein